MRRFVIGGNWKMQVLTVDDAEKKAQTIASTIENIKRVEVFIAPPFNSLFNVKQIIAKTKLRIAGQNMHYIEQGAFTGQISVLSLLDAGCNYVILGHSEPRRIFGESNQTINLKVLKALQHGLKVVLCIGETAKEREEGLTREINSSQLSECLFGVSDEELKKIIIAYEPVWAINNPYLNPGIEIKPATPTQAASAHKMIRDWIRKEFGNPIGEWIRIIYGGSMSQSNARELLEITDIDGGLIGGASLTAESFTPIIQIAEELSKDIEELR
ncbi:triose-phosphate isomerase [Candidatus Hodarchaeum mangrovi]